MRANPGAFRVGQRMEVQLLRAHQTRVDHGGDQVVGVVEHSQGCQGARLDIERVTHLIARRKAEPAGGTDPGVQGLQVHVAIFVGHDQEDGDLSCL